MVESYKHDLEDKIILGFLQKPQNSLITTAPYTPSKVGGKPAWIVPESARLEERCQYCGFYKQFLLQLYANSTDPSLEDYHRTLYVFSCLSPQCIGTQRAIQIHRAIMKNKNTHGIQFADEDLFDEVQNSYQQQLIDRGLIDLEDDKQLDDEEEAKSIIGKDQKDIKITFQEFMIVNEPEEPETTKFYLKESARIKNKQPSQRQQAEDDDEDVDEEDDEDQLEEVFLKNQANSNKDKRQIDKLVKKTLKQQEEDEREQAEFEGSEKAKIDQVEVEEYEKFIKKNHSNYQAIDDYYKLCEVVCKVDPEQVLRYVNDREQGSVEPLWVSQKNIIDPSKVLPCEKCGQARTFEFQVMPQLFDYLKELMLVDWSTIVFYTCQNPKCIPDYKEGEFLIKEFSFIQFSEDFEKVQYGDDKQIEKQKQRKREQELKEQQEMQSFVAQEKTQQTKENTDSVLTQDKKSKKANKAQKQQSSNAREEVNSEVQNQLQDLMKDLTFQ